MFATKRGKSFGKVDWDELGLQVVKVEREFNRKAEFTNEDDRFRKMFYEEPLPPHNQVEAISDEEKKNAVERVFRLNCRNSGTFNHSSR